MEWFDIPISTPWKIIYNYNRLIKLCNCSNIKSRKLYKIYLQPRHFTPTGKKVKSVKNLCLLEQLYTSQNIHRRNYNFLSGPPNLYFEKLNYIKNDAVFSNPDFEIILTEKKNKLMIIPVYLHLTKLISHTSWFQKSKFLNKIYSTDSHTVLPYIQIKILHIKIFSLYYL